MKKICTTCNTKKDVSSFRKQKLGKFGVSARCKQCGNIYDKQYRQENLQPLWAEENMKKLDKYSEKGGDL